jgi:hypothetical protein
MIPDIDNGKVRNRAAESHGFIMYANFCKYKISKNTEKGIGIVFDLYQLS